MIVRSLIFLIWPLSIALLLPLTIKAKGFKIVKPTALAQSVSSAQKHLPASPSFFTGSHLSTRWGLSTWRWREGLNDSLGVLLSLNLDWEKELIPNLLFKAQLDLKASKSRLQQHVFGQSSSGFYSLREAKLQAFVTPHFSLGFGVLSEAFWDKDLLINSSSSFIGARESWDFLETEELSFKMHLEQSIPPSSSSDSYRLENESLPYFLMGQLDLVYRQKYWSLKSNIFYFSYLNLPAVVAYQSSLLGNIPLDPNASPSESRFSWGFGLIGGGFDYYSDKGFGVKSYFVLNHKADRSVGKARSLKLYFDQVSLFSQDLTLDLEEFFIEHDATVSYYNSTAYGNTNREGFAVALSWKMNKISKIKLRYIQSGLINKNSIQDKLQSISIGLESDYEFF